MSRLSSPVTADDHTQGSTDAKVTLVEYGDFQCPDAGYAFPIVRKLQKHFGDDLCFVYRHFPLAKIHPWAEPAAELAEYADTEGRFWQVHDALFEEQSDLSADLLPDMAGEQHLDADKAATAIANRMFAERIEQQVEGGKQSGVHATPTFFINGKLHGGPCEFEDLLHAIEQEMI